MADGTILIDTNLDKKELEKQVGQLNGIVEKGMSGAKVAIGAIATAITGLGASAVKFGTDYQKASNQLQSETGATAEEMDTLNEAMKNTYANNFGESIEDVSNVIAELRKQVGVKWSADAFQEMTQDAIILRDTFDYDVNESVRAAKALMDQFGIEGSDAFDLIAQASQKGLDFSGELLDNVSEYSVQFEKLGFSAEDMFNIFESGANAGAFNLDKIGDAVKEFSIRAIDGSNTTIDGFTRLGLNADEMAQKFASGGDIAKEAFYEVIQRIAEMDNSVEQSIVGVDLFGTMWEDLGPDVVTQLGSIRDGFDSTKDTMQELSQIKYDDLGSALQGIGRQIQTNLLLPISDKLLPVFNDLANKLNEAFSSGELQSSIDKIAGSIGTLVEGVAGFVEKWLPSIIDLVSWIIKNAPTIISLLAGISVGLKVFQIGKGIADLVSKFKEASTAVKGVSGAFKAFNAVLNANPIILIVSIIATLVTALITLWNTNDDFRNAVTSAWNAVKEAVGNVINAIITFFTETVPNAFNDFITTVTDFVNSVIDWFKNLPYNIGKFIGEIIGHIANFGLRLVDFVTKDIPNFINNVVDWFKKLPGRIWEWLQNSLNNVAKWGKDLINKGMEAARNLVDKVVNTIKELPGKVLDIGKNLVQGLWNGITGAAGWLWDKISGFASGIIDGFKSAFGIHSPSKVFNQEIGKFLALGLGEGFDDNINNVFKDMKSTVDFETQKLSANLSTTATNNKLFTANILMKPSDIYLDSTKVGRAVTPAVTKTLRGAGAY